jgi:arylsulfatase
VGHVIDLMATCVEVGGATYPAERNGVAVTPIGGKSLVPAFADRPLDRESLAWEHEGNRPSGLGSGSWWRRRAPEPVDVVDRAADLDAAGAGDPALARVEDPLRSHEEAGRFPSELAPHG